MRRYLLLFWITGLSGIAAAQDSSKMTTPESKHDSYKKSRQTTSEKFHVDFMHVQEVVVDPGRETPGTVTTVAVKPTATVSLSSVVDPSLEVDVPVNKRLINGANQFDSRVELRSLNPALAWVKPVVRNAMSVAVIVYKYKIHKISATYYQLDVSNTLGMAYQLCPGEPFRDEPVVGTGTAIVTGKRKMLTAAHVFTASPDQYAVIFGYEIINATGAYEQIIPADSIYFPQKIEKSSADLDIAEFSVDRDLKAPLLNWSAEVNPPVNESVYMIGFPYGLPKKVAANASVQANNDLYSLYTTLDAFEGNSGSPVFNLQTNEVIGILVSGGVDFRWNGSCNSSTICAIPYCQGEKAIRITAIKNFLGH